MDAAKVAAGVIVEARPAPVSVVPSRTAVVVVDMQNDFGSTGGMFERAGIDISSIRAVIPSTVALIGHVRRCGVKIVYLKMAFQADLSDAGALDSPNRIKHALFKVGESVVAPTGSPSRVLVRDTWSTDIIDELRPEPDDVVIYKHRFSGFFQTDLDQILRASGIDTLLFVGATTSVCVESTVRDAMYRDFHCLVVEDCVAEPIGNELQRTNHDASLVVLQVLFGSITDSRSVIAALGFPTATL
jgi:ureidoacrylate peracid hydrolase